MTKTLPARRRKVIATALRALARVVMEVLGHSHISLTLGTYSHVVPEVAEEAAKWMGDALWD